MQMQKSAADVAMENAYWDEMAKQAAALENQAGEDLFNAEFEAHTAKLAAYDPEYAQAITAELQKAAFNQAVHNELAAHGLVWQ